MHLVSFESVKFISTELKEMRRTIVLSRIELYGEIDGNHRGGLYKTEKLNRSCLVEPIYGFREGENLEHDFFPHYGDKYQRGEKIAAQSRHELR